MSEVTPQVEETAVMEDENPIERAIAILKERHPEDVVDDPRGYEGVMVSPDALIEVATAARDEFGFDYLSSITGVDQMDDGKLEAVYHLYSTDGGGALVLHVQTDREEPSIPSLVPLWQGADFQEREAYDMFGIIFEGHPDLRTLHKAPHFGADVQPLRRDFDVTKFKEEIHELKQFLVCIKWMIMDP